MLAAWLLVGLWSLPITTVLLFTPLARRARGLLPAAVIPLATAAAAVAVAVAMGAVAVFAVAGGVLLAVAAVAWFPPTRPWGAVGRAAWSAAVVTGLLYLAYMLDWTFRSGLGPVGTAGGLLLWLLEVGAYLLGLAYFWEMVDVLSTAGWSRRFVDPPADPLSGGDDLPFVSLHVPAHNEPPDMVIATLGRLLQLDYPADRLEIVMIDDNTEEPALWQPVADFAAGHPGRIHFHHLEDWPGFKSGALNFALTVTDPRAEVVGIVDADYLTDPDYLRRCAPLFRREPHLGFVQTPQDYRDWQQAAYYRRLYYSYLYFFAVSQASRNERDGAIFGGTMGLIRRSALSEVGGWDEWCITEDAELSLRLLRAGWSGRHIETSFGRGVMPLTFEALKRQRFRWCFGGIQILRMHWRSLLPWDRHPANRLTPAQRLAYLSGGLQWYGDLLSLMFSAFLLLTTADLALGSGVVFRRLTGFLLVVVPVLSLINVTRAVALLRRATRASWRDAIGAFGIWAALAWTVAQASVRGAFAPAGVFLRTPKTRGDVGWRDALRANRSEVLLAAVGLAGMVAAATSVAGAARWLIPTLLAIPVGGQLAAPFNTVAALRAELPDELRRRRRTERRRAWATGPLRPTRVAGAAALLAGATVAALMFFTPGGRPGTSPSLLHEASGHGPATTVPAATTAQPPNKPGHGRAPSGGPPSGRATTTLAPAGGGSVPSPATSAAGGPAAPATIPTPATVVPASPAPATTAPAGSTTTATTAAVVTTTTHGAATTGPPASTPGTTATTAAHTTGPPTTTSRTTPTSHP